MRATKCGLIMSKNIIMIDQSWLERMSGSVFFRGKSIVMKIYYSLFKVHNVIRRQVLILFLFIFLISYF